MLAIIIFSYKQSCPSSHRTGHQARKHSCCERVWSRFQSADELEMLLVVHKCTIRCCQNFNLPLWVPGPRVATAPSWLMRWAWGRPCRAWRCAGRCSDRERTEADLWPGGCWWSRPAASCRTGRRSLISGWAANGSTFSPWIRCDVD